MNHILLAAKGLKIFGQDLEIPVTVEREKSAKPEKPAKSEQEPKTKAAPAAPAAPEVKAESKPEVNPASETANAVNNLTAIAAGVATSVVNDAEDQVQIFNWCFNFILCTWQSNYENIFGTFWKHFPALMKWSLLVPPHSSLHYLSLFVKLQLLPFP